MSTWTKDLSLAPKDKQLLVRHPDWECPAIIEWKEYEDEQFWGFSDEMIEDVSGSLDLKFVPECEWMVIPE